MASTCVRSQESQGTASRRRPSVDWPLSREEKKFQAMHLYEKDVQTCNQLLDRKDKQLRAAKEEIKELRRQSTASKSEMDELRRMSTASTGTGGRSTPNDAANLSPSVNPSEEDRQDTLVDKWPEELESDGGKCQDANAGPHPTSRRSSSLEVVSSLLAPAWKVDQGEQGSQKKGELRSRHQRHATRTASPRRMRRSNSLETGSSWWAPAGQVWKAVRNGARRATETAAETARILSEEARIMADEARTIIPDYREIGLAPDAKNQDADSANVPPSAKPTARPGPAQFMEWRVELEPDAESAGLRLEPPVAGEARRVHSVMHGLAIDEWNSCRAPVTVFLKESRESRESREKVARVTVRSGDELVAVDEEAPESSVEEVEICRTLTFRRNVARRPPAEDAFA